MALCHVSDRHSQPKLSKSTDPLLTHILLMDRCLVMLSCFSSTLQTVARQAPLSIGVSRQEY